MKDRILELAKEHGGFWTEELEAFYKAAHADGQRAMRERAANVCDNWRRTDNAQEAILKLRIE